MSKTMGITDLQNLFYVWMSKFEKRSLENIKVHCDFLNESYGLNLTYPNWSIFWPLVFNGLIDHIGKGYYALTTPIIIDYGRHYVYINYKPNIIESKQLNTGIYLSRELDNPRDFAVIKVNPLSILKRFPTVKILWTLLTNHNVPLKNWSITIGNMVKVSQNLKQKV